MDFNDLIGKPCDFHGVDNCRFRLGFEGKIYTFEAVEDPDDGYRSYLDKVALVTDADGIFFAVSVATVIPTVIDGGYNNDMGYPDGFDGYELRDAATGHVWLRLGTEHAGDGYPISRFDYMPSGEHHPDPVTTG